MTTKETIEMLKREIEAIHTVLAEQGRAIHDLRKDNETEHKAIWATIANDTKKMYDNLNDYPKI